MNFLPSLFLLLLLGQPIQVNAAAEGDSLSLFVAGLDAFERQDYEAAFHLFSLAADQGDKQSQYLLGSMYESGAGINQDFKQAIDWFTHAADQGDADSQLYLGMMNYYGEGTPKDYVMAHMWLDLSAENGNEEATELMNVVAKKMTAEEIVRARDLARKR